MALKDEPLSLYTPESEMSSSGGGVVDVSVVRIGYPVRGWRYVIVQ